MKMLFVLGLPVVLASTAVFQGPPLATFAQAKKRHFRLDSSRQNDTPRAANWETLSFEMRFSSPRDALLF